MDCFTTFPFSNTSSVGMLITPNFAASAGSSSTLTFPTLHFPLLQLLHPRLEITSGMVHTRLPRNLRELFPLPVILPAQNYFLLLFTIAIFLLLSISISGLKYQNIRFLISQFIYNCLIY